jgi:hypothetical protein
MMILTLQEAVLVTEQEVVGFLESCGVTASYARSEKKPLSRRRRTLHGGCSGRIRQQGTAGASASSVCAPLRPALIGRSSCPPLGDRTLVDWHHLAQKTKPAATFAAGPYIRVLQVGRMLQVSG